MISATASSSADVACMYVHVCITDEVTTELTYRLTGWLTYCTGCAMIMVHNMLCVRWCMGHCTSVYVLLFSILFVVFFLFLFYVACSSVRVVLCLCCCCFMTVVWCTA